jgi:hypothetical protein
MLAGCGAPVTATSVPATDAAPSERADLTVRRDAIVSPDGSFLLPLPADRSQGADAGVKRGGGNGYLIEPLATYLGKAVIHPPIRIDFEGTTPFRLVSEVLFTAGQFAPSPWEVRRLDAPTHAAAITAGVPRGPGELGLTAILVHDGLSLKTPGGNIATGCNDTGPSERGPAVLRSKGAQDTEAIRRCLAHLKKEVPEIARERSIVVTASPDVPFEEFLEVVEAVKGEHAELFPEVLIAVTR